MARIDDYTNAAALGKKDLAQKDPKQTADLAGASLEMDSEGNTVLALDFLNRAVTVTWPDLTVTFKASGEKIPIQQQILLFHYLTGAKGARTTGEWIAYQEVPDGKFYLDAFLRRAKHPMVQVFGSQPDLLIQLAMEMYEAVILDQGDVSVQVQALPLIPVALILWRGDDEFPPEGTILFDRSISNFFSAEDIAWLAGMIIYPLIGMAKSG